MGRSWTLVVAAAVAAMVLFAIGSLLDVSWMRVAFGIPALVLLPGGLLVWLLFPRYSTGPGSRQLRLLERVVIAVGLSIVVTALLGLVLESMGAFREAVFVWSLLGLCAGFLLAAIVRSLRLPEAERWPQEWTGPAVAPSTIALAVLALAATGAVVGYMVDPVEPMRYTELALLGATGELNCYPSAYANGGYTATELTANGTVRDNECPVRADKVTLVVASHEHRSTDYTLAVWWANGDGQDPTAVREVDETRFTLPDDGNDRYRSLFTLDPPPAGGPHFLVFQLYKGPAPSIAAGQPLPEADYEVRLAIHQGA